MSKLPSRHRQYQESNISRSFPVPRPFHNTQFRCHTLPTTPSSGATPFPQHPIPVPHPSHNASFRCHTIPITPHFGATLLSLVPPPSGQPQCQPTTLPAGCKLWSCVQSWTLSTSVLYPHPPPPNLPEHADITSSSLVCVWWLDKHGNVSLVLS